MLRITILLLGMSFIMLVAKAGDDDPKRWKKGFVITFGGDTIRGRVKINDYLDINYDCQHKLEFKDQGNRLVYYFPEAIRTFCYFDGRDTATEAGRYESVSDPTGEGRVFLRAYCIGTCRVYGQTVTELRGNRDRGDVMHAPLIPMEKKYIQIRGGNFVLLKRVGFKETMKEIFADCPIIISRLDSKAYSYSNWQAMVNDYNSGICR